MTVVRTRWIDMVKGIGILLVTIGHSRFGDSGWPAVWIYSFHMPIFFVMAGLCYDENRYSSYWVYLKRKGVALAYPYLMLTLFVAILMTLFCVGEDKNYFYEYFVAHHFPGWAIGGFWFIRVLIVVELVYALFQRVLPSVLILAVMALGAFWQPEGYCFRLNTIMVSLAFYALGHSSRLLLKTAIPCKFLLFGTVGCFAAHLVCLALGMGFIVGYGSCDLGNPLKFYPTAILGVAFVSGLAMTLDSVVWMGCVSRSLAWLGKHSIILLAIHGSCGICRHSWGAQWPMLSGWPSQMMEIGLMIMLMYLLSGPLNFFITIRLHLKQ